MTGGHKPGMKPMVEHVWSEKHSPGHARVGRSADSNQEPDPWLRGESDDSALVRFSSGDELAQFMSGQEQGIDRAKAEERFKRLAQSLEWRGNGTLADDNERAIMKEGYDLGLAPRTVLDKYCKNDSPMQQWLKRNYAIKIPTNS